MKSKTSFCDLTVLKKDITRFLPVWVIYLIGGLLLTTAFSTSSSYSVSNTIHEYLSTAMPYITCGYAIVVALLLFGDLSNSRMCNALHAMPLRRETWFCTHFIAGMLMALVPDLILALVLMPMLESLWYVALIWVGGSMLMYLFFFGMACLCCLSTGNKFAALLVYALINLFSMELLWPTEELVMPFLYGVRLSTTVFYCFCPVVRLMGADYFTITNLGESYYSGKYAFGGFESGWIYLFILAAIGIAMTVAALLLYRKRHLEVAGDFAAIAPVRWAISIFGSLLCGMIFRLFAHNSVEYVFLFVGITVGFFLLQMLLQRKVKIFSKATFIKWGALVLSCGLILTLAAVDILGLETYVPKANRIESVVIADEYLSDNELDRIDAGNFLSGYVRPLTITDPEQIQTVLEAHKAVIADPDKLANGKYTYIILHYRLKGGQTVTRSYYISRNHTAYKTIAPLFPVADFLSSFYSARDFASGIVYFELEGEYVSNQFYTELATCLWNDAVNGKLQSYTTADGLTLCVRWRSEYSASTEKLYIVPGCESYKFIQSHLEDLNEYE